MDRVRTGTVVVSLALAALLVGASSLAEQAEERQVAFTRTSSALLASVSFPDLFDAAAQRRLKNGLRHVVVTRVAVHRVGQDQPISVALQSCRVHYDVWDEDFGLVLRDHRGQTAQRVRRLSEAVALCTTLDRFPVASLSTLATGRSYVAVISELNPVSDEQLQRIRQRLRSPQGGYQRLGRGNSFFGSVVAIFVNHRIGAADRAIRFRSQVIGP